MQFLQGRGEHNQVHFEDRQTVAWLQDGMGVWEVTHSLLTIFITLGQNSEP